MFNVGDRVYHKDIPSIFGIILEMNCHSGFHPDDVCCKTRWYPKAHIDKSLEGVYGYEVSEPVENYILMEPALIEYKYDQSGDTEEDI